MSSRPTWLSRIFSAAVLCAFMTTVVGVFHTWVYIRAITSLLELSRHLHKSRGIKIQVQWVQLALSLYGLITAISILLWVKMAHHASPVSNLLLPSSAISSFFTVAMALINLIFVFALKKEAFIRCHWRFDFTWTDHDPKCTALGSHFTTDFVPWVTASVIRVLVTFIITMLWLLTIWKFRKMLPVKVIAESTLAPEATDRSSNQASQNESQEKSSRVDIEFDKSYEMELSEEKLCDRIHNEPNCAHGINKLMEPCNCMSNRPNSLQSEGRSDTFISVNCGQHGWMSTIYGNSECSQTWEDHSHSLKSKRNTFGQQLNSSQKTYSFGSGWSKLINIRSLSSLPKDSRACRGSTIWSFDSKPKITFIEKLTEEVTLVSGTMIYPLLVRRGG
ncbi:hypothetical protein CROQUDRAFT_135040 [Cronartium quercuum f. sp. fusiforme G11]|uniref:Uncharacterized protein n=1 Tax=Cronartium quercuum f. sp. fusiforme G11 TaxID=708437 RepID=A0A9P6NCZ8_9BASI|nr:hypothetical protein CROQUDRAFT_135040 [Cronartium quercuum f. sp. fusiforme G11]